MRKADEAHGKAENDRVTQKINCSLPSIGLSGSEELAWIAIIRMEDVRGHGQITPARLDQNSRRHRSMIASTPASQVGADGAQTRAFRGVLQMRSQILAKEPHTPEVTLTEETGSLE